MLNAGSGQRPRSRRDGLRLKRFQLVRGGHFRRQYSAQAKKAGEAMMKVMRDFAEPLSVQDARDACTFCRSILESQVRGCPYNDAALEAEEDLDAVAKADEPDA